jgi:predicted dinucleotide-binding enzyme
MNVAVIGAGNVGGALARAWVRAGHRVHLGVRNPRDAKVRALLDLGVRISAHTVREAAAQAEVILIAARPEATREIAEAIGEAHGKTIIDAMNLVGSRVGEFTSTAEALRAWTGSAEVIKCFNSTGFNVMADPDFAGVKADMFVAGNSARGKEVARRLALDAGFGECYDLGGDDRIPLLESLAMVWIDLAIFQGMGREIAFKLLER